jgi:hypothetical protein
VGSLRTDQLADDALQRGVVVQPALDVLQARRQKQDIAVLELDQQELDLVCPVLARR